MSLELQVVSSKPEQLPGTSPRQQGRGKKMAMLSFCGIDVSKDRLDVTVLPGQQSFAVRNDTAALGRADNTTHGGNRPVW
jgi:hypothetical protein